MAQQQLKPVKAVIPPHVANVLMRELRASSAQEAVDKVIIMLQGEKPSTKATPRPKK